MKWHSAGESAKREHDEAPYLKPTSDKKPEKIGGVRI